MSFTKGLPKKRKVELSQEEIELILHLVYERHLKSNLEDNNYDMIYSLKEKLREEVRYVAR